MEVQLVPNLREKTRYILHYRNLQHFLQLGMRLKKIHRAIRFDQSPWVEPYIRNNTELRKKAKSNFDMRRNADQYDTTTIPKTTRCSAQPTRRCWGK